MRWSCCPVCKQEIKADSDSEYFPFCGKRCQMVDLGHWFDGNYVIPTDEPPTSNGPSEETE